MSTLLGPFYFNSLMTPWALLLIIPVLLLFFAEIAARTPGVMLISTGETLAKIRGHRRFLLRRLPAVLRLVALTLLIIALARPITGYRVQRDRANITDIMLCVDVSGSMQSMDFIVHGERQDRLFVTKQAVRDFLASRKDRPADRYGLDRIGLVLYATYAWTAAPLTLDYGVLEHELNNASIDPDDRKRTSTAIGSAIGLAVAKLRKSEAKSRVIILLTDGLNNAGEIDPITAARLAKEYDIRIYTIGAGSTAGGVIPVQTLFGVQMQRTGDGVDEEALKRIASATGGRYFRATDTASLADAYAEINKLETTEVEIGDYYEHSEGFLAYAVAGTVVMLASIFSRRRWFEAIP